MCSQFDEFYDGELAAAATGTFRDHLATCDRCQASLRGRMQETMILDEASPAVVIPIRRMRYAAIGAMVAVAATVALVWSLKGKKPPQVADLGVTLTIEKGAATMRGQSAHVGDRVHVKAAGQLWIYRGDHELVLACPGHAGCRDGGADVDLAVMGTYQFVSLGSTSVVPAGDFDTDLAKVATANVKYKVETLDVQ